LSDQVYRITTTSWKNDDAAGVAEFEISCREVATSDGVSAAASIATLKGFAFKGGYPDEDADEIFAAFDMRDGHAADAHALLLRQQESIEDALTQFDAWLASQIIHLERLDVDPGHRGKGLGLRMLREARDMLARPATLVILKAHPDKDPTPENCLKLASYYAQDPALGLRAVSDEAPGWMVASWDEPSSLSSDTGIWLDHDMS